MGEVIPYAGSANTCDRELEPHVPAWRSLTCFLFPILFFFFQEVNVSSLFLSLAHVDLLSIMTFGFILQPFSLSLFYGSMLLLAELIFQKTDGSDPVLSK